MAQALAPVFLEGNRVVLQGDPRPKVSKILDLGGKRAAQVVRLPSREASDGERLGMDQVIDRTATQAPIYLKCVDPANPRSARSGNGPARVAERPAQGSGTQAAEVGGPGGARQAGRKPPNTSSDFGEQHGATVGSDQSDLGKGSGAIQRASSEAGAPEVSGRDTPGPAGTGTGAFPNERPLEGEGGGSGSVLQGKQGSRQAREGGFDASFSGTMGSAEGKGDKAERPDKKASGGA